MNIQEFLDGKCFDAYTYFGAHPYYGGTVFRTYAPCAWKAGVCGDFSDWDIIELTKINDCGIYEAYVPGANPGMKYTYRIYDRKGNMSEHCDPYGSGMETRPFYASIIRDLDSYKFNDLEWMQTRSDCKEKPLNIYEVHLGSWKRDGSGHVSYRMIADTLIPYVKECGYNYVEFMPLTEYPCDESWGYQTSCFYSPTSRYGTASDLMEMVDRFHQNGIGLILDFVPGHFAVDSFGLKEYDGSCVYEYPFEDVKYNEWGSLNFNLSRNDVRSFLFSAAAYWIDKFHFDGLRIDSVSNILYWQGDKSRGENKNGSGFLRGLNQGLKHRYPDILTAAEDSTQFPHVTESPEKGGLGFDYKWDMGWMHDTLEYLQMDPYLRSSSANKLSFSMWYFYSERFLLPLSHDEVVHGKATILQKMNGHYEDKFPQARVLYTYMYIHPGKKLNFMGNEIGQFREWSEKDQEDWDLLSFPYHRQFHDYIKALNHLYITYPQLYYDYGFGNFEWADLNSSGRAIFSIRRKTADSQLLAVMHFDCDPAAPYCVDIPPHKEIRLLLHSSQTCYGGSIENPWNTFRVIQSKAETDENRNSSSDRQETDIKTAVTEPDFTSKLEITVGPYDCLIFYIKY